MARIVKGSHSFTCTSTRLYTNAMNHLLLPSQPKLVLIYRPRRDGRLSWPRHHLVSNQFAEDHYVTDIAVVSCSDRRASHVG